MYSILNVTVLGSMILLIYIMIDFFRFREANIFKRLFFYSFIFYIVCVVQLTTGGIIVPPQMGDSYLVRVQPMPFYFFWDLIGHYNDAGFDWFFWNAMKLSFYNLIMLMPLGIYLAIFGVKNIKKAALITLLVSFAIEISQLVLGYLGVVSALRQFNVDDLLLNTAGGVIGYAAFVFLKKRYTFFSKRK